MQRQDEFRWLHPASTWLTSAHSSALRLGSGLTLIWYFSRKAINSGTVHSNCVADISCRVCNDQPQGKEACYRMTLWWPDQNMVIPSQNQAMSFSSRNIISASKYFFNLRNFYFILILPCCKRLLDCTPRTGQGMLESSRESSQPSSFKFSSKSQIRFLENNIFCV